MKSKTIRKKLIEDKLSLITDSINEISDNLPSDFEDFKKLGLIKDGIYKKIEFAIENIIDICNIINSDLRLGVPEAEDDIFNNLESKKLFDKKVINLIKEMKSFRNILVHKYGKINDEEAFENISKGINDFEIILNEIEKIIN